MSKWAQLFKYDESSPSFLRWKVERRSGRNGARVNVSPGDVAGSVNSTGYFQIRTKLEGDVRITTLLCHRVIWELFNGEIPKGLFIDHIDGNRTGNDINNLRVVSRAGNMRNARQRCDNQSGVTGVSLISNGQGRMYWSARCERSKKEILQKRYATEVHGYDEAFRLACEWRAKMIEQLNAEGAGYSERHGKE